jgi:acid-sensing ion channel, other
MTALSQVCDPKIFSAIDPKNETNCNKCVENLREMAIPFNDMFLLCTYRRKMERCDTMFDEVITAEGICYTFNGVNNFRNSTKLDHRWSLEDGYKFDQLLHSYPRRALGAGMQFGFFVVMGICRHDFDFVCRGPTQGFKVTLHMPIEYPQVAKHFLRVPLKQETMIIVKPKMMTTENDVRSFPLESRKCYFFHERYLRFFRGYTQRNCEIECLANFTIGKCGCTKFHMPLVPDVPVCGADKINCYDSAEAEILQHQILEKLQQGQSSECNCLPSCTSITYEAEISQADFDANELLKAFGMDLSQLATVNLQTQASTRITKECGNNLQMARLIIFFKDEQFMAIRRSRMYGSNEFLADCGGLLGLFMGVSFMSILEIIYFATVRLYFNLKKMQRHRKKAPLALNSN